MKQWLPEQLETVGCDLCGAASAQSKFKRGDGMTVVQCPQCGLAFLSPRPRAEFICKLYGVDYFTGEAAERGDGGLRLNVDDVGNVTVDLDKAASRPVELLAKLDGSLVGKRILEVGCATGDMLLQLQRRGAHVQGVELSSFAAGVAQQRGLDVVAATIEDFASRQSVAVDALLSFEVIEHVLSPSSFFATVVKLVRPGGLVLLSTPNYACTRRYGYEWAGLNGSFEHIYFLEQRTLAQIAVKHGLVPVYVESTKYLGGPLLPLKGWDRFRERVKTLAYFVGEVGWINTLRAVSSRASPVYQYGLGHTLLMAFRKQ